MVHEIKRSAWVILCWLFINISFAANNLPNQFKTLLSSTLKEYETPGAVLLVSSPKLGTIIVPGGLADTKTKKPMVPESNFRIASMSKSFLAVTVMKLAEQGVLKLDDKIMNLLPPRVEIDRVANGKEITVRELLQMRSGIPNYSDYDAYYDLVEVKKDNGKWTPEECIGVIYDEKPNFVQGKSYEYANTNYILLQIMVEHLTHKPYSQVIYEQILRPLNLTHTFVEGHGISRNDVLNTHGYEDDDDVITDVTFLNDGFGLADGGMISTVEDINRFVQALLMDKTVLKPSSLKEMLNFKGDEDYGLGISKEEVNEEDAWTHNGSSSGYAGQYYYFPEQQLTVVILTNYFDTEMFEDFISEALNLLV
jgi:D-alanyl-D-alanine carboxypeptidase